MQRGTNQRPDSVKKISKRMSEIWAERRSNPKAMKALGDKMRAGRRSARAKKEAERNA